MSNVLNQGNLSIDQHSKYRRVRNMLCDECTRPKWPWLPGDGSKASRKEANKFMLFSLIYHQMDSAQACSSAKKLSEDLLGDPDDLWGEITAKPQSYIRKLFSDHKLHKFPERIADSVMETAVRIRDQYGGNAREIWENQTPYKTLSLLENLQIEPTTSNLIIDALITTKQLATGPWLPGDGSKASRKEANKFMLFSLIDHQMDSAQAWSSAKKLSEDLLGDPDDLWGEITAKPQSYIRKLFSDHNLHKFPERTATKVLKVAARIRDRHNGDARRIWANQPEPDILQRLQDLQIEPETCYLIIDELCYTQQLSGMPWLPTDGSKASRKEANKFMLFSLIDHQMDSAQAWSSAKKLSEDLLGDPDDLWGEITAKPQSYIRKLFSDHNLHKFPERTATKVLKVAARIRDRHNGDARRIWANQQMPDILQRLQDLQIEPSTCSLIINDLRDTQHTPKWPWLPTDGSTVSKKEANKFMLGAILDYRMRSEVVWFNAKKLSEDLLGDPDDLWGAISSKSQPHIRKMFSDYSLHRFTERAADRVLRIAEIINNKYDGDARKIWKEQKTNVTLQHLEDIRCGSVISRMIVGALKDTKQIQGKADLKADSNVCRVLGRVFDNSEISPDRALEIADAMEPSNSWILDEALFSLGKSVCHKRQPIVTCVA